MVRQASSAVGAIVAVVVGADGWYADVTIAGLSTGGTYNLGLGANNDPMTGTPTVTFTVVSLGFDTSGNATTTTRTVYGTKQVRKPYPNDSSNQETASGGNVTVRVALSDYIYAKDNTGAGNSGTAVTATFLGGLYTQGSNPSNSATSVSVTNNSTLAYPKVIGNWTWPGYEKLPASFALRAVSFHSSATGGRPVQCVKFTATDAHSNSNTVTVTTPTVDRSIGDDTPVVEYVATMDGSAFTQGDVVTCAFVAYPAVGDAAACLDTTAGTAQLTPLYGPIAAICDKAGTYATSVAVVDPVSGNDGTGVVTGSFSIGGPPSAFATISGAYNALRTYNNTNYGRNNCGGSIIYLKDGSHAWVGGTPTLGTTPNSWLTIAKYPTSIRSNVVIASQSGGQSLGLKVKLQDLTITANAGMVIGGAGSALWVDRCEINCPAAFPSPFSVDILHSTRCLVTSLGAGYQMFDTGAVALIRGNNVVAAATYHHIYTAVGNSFPAAPTVLDSYSGQTIPTSVNTIFSFNRVTGTIGGNTPVLLRNTVVDTHGCAVVQNLMEVGPSSGNNILGIAADSTKQTPVNNVLIWNNVVVGQRVNMAYNEVDSVTGGGGIAVRQGWSVKNNIFDDVNIKSDTFNGGTGLVADGTKIGNWPVLYGCGCSGNLYPETTGIGAPGAFLLEFPGLKTYQPAGSGQPPTGSTNAPGLAQFVSRQSFDGVSSGPGGGDYHLRGTSPAVALQRDLVLPLDLLGNPRSPTDASGVYALAPVFTAGRGGHNARTAGGTPRHGLFFPTRTMVSQVTSAGQRNIRRRIGFLSRRGAFQTIAASPLTISYRVQRHPSVGGVTRRGVFTAPPLIGLTVGSGPVAPTLRASRRLTGLVVRRGTFNPPPAMGLVVGPAPLAPPFRAPRRIVTIPTRRSAVSPRAIQGASAGAGPFVVPTIRQRRISGFPTRRGLIRTRTWFEPPTTQALPPVTIRQVGGRPRWFPLPRRGTYSSALLVGLAPPAPLAPPTFTAHRVPRGVVASRGEFHTTPAARPELARFQGQRQRSLPEVSRGHFTRGPTPTLSVPPGFLVRAARPSGRIITRSTRVTIPPFAQLPPSLAPAQLSRARSRSGWLARTGRFTGPVPTPPPAGPGPLAPAMRRGARRYGFLPRRGAFAEIPQAGLAPYSRGRMSPATRTTATMRGRSG